MLPLSAQSTETDIEVSKDERQRFEDTRYHKTEPIAVRKYREHMARQQKVENQQMAKKYVLAMAAVGTIIMIMSESEFFN